MSRVFIVIVSFNDREWLEPCLQSALASSSVSDIVLIDNASLDGAAQFVREAFPEVMVIANQSNRGFSAACNQGLAIGMGAGCDYFFLINPDTRCPSGLITGLLSFMDNHPQYGVVGPLQNRYELSSSVASVELNHWTLRMLANPTTSYLATWIPRLRAEQPIPSPTPAVIDLSYVQGSAFFVRRKAIDQVGVFDEAYHTFHEEVDLCRRIWWAGFRVGLLTWLRIEHGARDLSHPTLRKVFHRTKNRYYFLFTDPSAGAFEKIRLSFRWFWSDLTVAFSNPGRSMLIRLLAIPPAGLWLVFKWQVIRHALWSRSNDFRTSPWRELSGRGR